MARRSSARGAAAVEFAIVAFALLVLLTVFVDAAWLLFAQGTFAGAAREAARDFAINKSQASARSAANAAAAIALDPTDPLTDVDVKFNPETCTPGAIVVVTITHTQETLTKFVLKTVQLKATGAMRCGG